MSATSESVLDKPRGAVVVRPSTENDVAAMIAIYTHHIHAGRGQRRYRADAGRRHQAAAQEHAAAPAAASRGRARRRDRGLCLCGALPQAPGLSLCGQALDLRPSRPCLHRDRPAAAAGADRGLRQRGLPPDVRLYRRRQCRVAAACTRPTASAGSASWRASASSTASWADSVLMQRAIGAGQPRRRRWRSSTRAPRRCRSARAPSLSISR